MRKQCKNFFLSYFFLYILVALSRKKNNYRTLSKTSKNPAFCGQFDRDILISPSTYLKFIQTLSSIYASNNAKLEERKSKLEKLIQKVQGIDTQVVELKQELKDIQPKLENAGENMLSKRERIKQLQESKAAKTEEFKTKDEILKGLRAEVKELQSSTDSELVAVKEKMQGIKGRVYKIKLAKKRVHPLFL